MQFKPILFTYLLMISLKYFMKNVALYDRELQFAIVIKNRKWIEGMYCVQLGNYAKVWKLSVNLKKTKIVVFDKLESIFNLRIPFKGKVIEPCS